MEESRLKERITFEERIDETTHCPHDFACLYGSPECVSCSIASVDGDNILFLKEKGPRFCAYRLLWGESEICRCPTRYGLAISFPSWEQRKNTVGFWKADKNHIITNANRHAGEILGIAHDQFIGTRFVADSLSETFHHFLPFYDKAIRVGKTVRFETIPKGKLAQMQSLQSGWMIPRFRDQDLSHTLCIFEDAA